MTGMDSDVAGSSAGGFEIPPAPADDGPTTIRIHYWTPQLEEVLAQSGASTVVVEPWWEERGPGLEFLANYARQLRRLVVSWKGVKDASFISALHHLEEVSFAGVVDRLDFSQLPHLRRCKLEHPSGLGNVGACAGLEMLGLLGVRADDLTELRQLKRLRRLHLNEMRSLVSLEGIEDLSLEQIDLLYLGRLRSIVPLTRIKTIRELELVGCRAIIDLELLGQLRSLEVLKIVHGPPLRSLGWVGPMSELRHLAIGNTSLTGKHVSLAPFARLGKLRVLKLGAIRNVTNIEELGRLQSLEFLAIDGGPDVLSLGFLRSLVNLRHLVVRRTKIMDGELGVLLELPRLERVYALKPHRKHYSHNEEEIDAVLGARHPSRAQYPEE